MATAMQRCGGAARRTLAAATQQQPSSSFSSLSPSSSSLVLGLPIQCGRGDKKTKKGKIFIGSYGNSRPKKDKKIERIKDKNELPRSTPWPLPFKLI
ncbi:unnamed protein product [Linum tenue]|uniref:30S ribosomal protein S31, mitochondrial n=1 Tax=Linum tenue TaxID=586396 RepID=A0AAV0LV71_9ROSI|nr:unnamed protein product [Linum tenue]